MCIMSKYAMPLRHFGHVMNVIQRSLQKLRDVCSCSVHCTLESKLISRGGKADQVSG